MTHYSEGNKMVSVVPFGFFPVAMGSMLTSLAGKGSEASGNGVKMKSLVLIFSYNL